MKNIALTLIILFGLALPAFAAGKPISSGGGLTTGQFQTVVSAELLLGPRQSFQSVGSAFSAKGYSVTTRRQGGVQEVFLLYTGNETGLLPDQFYKLALSFGIPKNKAIILAEKTED